jgi:hypothetical protein
MNKKIIYIAIIVAIIIAIYVWQSNKKTVDLKLGLTPEQQQAAAEQNAINSQKIANAKNLYGTAGNNFCSSICNPVCGQVLSAQLNDTFRDASGNAVDWIKLYDTYNAGDMSYFNKVNVANMNFAYKC